MPHALFSHPPSVPLALVIDLGALAHNYRTICASLKKGTMCAAVLKANGCGMGLKEAATRLYREGCRHFFMAFLSEAIELKSYIGQDSFIYVLAGLRQGDEDVYVSHNLIPVLSDLSQIQAWNAFSITKGQCLKAVLHFDTGFTRTGISAEAVKKLTLLDLSHIEIVCVMSHLACAYQPGHPMNEAQRLSFDDLRKRFHTIPASFASTGAVRFGDVYHYDMVRVSIALTGCREADNPNLKPVLKAYSQVLQINTINTGETVGYDATFIAQRPSSIATLAGGYADGYFRSLSNRGEVYFQGKRLPIVGKVSMDMFTIDVTDVPIRPGDWVELFGDHLSAYEVAQSAGSVSWELFARLGPRFERFYVG